MKENFADYLKSLPSITSEKAIQSRLRAARRVERRVRNSLDNIVTNDSEMLNVLTILRTFDHHGNMQNALRHYYRFKNKRIFPRQKWT